MGIQRRSSGTSGRVATAVVGAILILAVAVGLLYHRGYLGRFTLVLSEDGSRIEHTRPGERSEAVIAALKTVADAQSRYKEMRGTYAPFMELLLGEGLVNGEIGTATDALMAFEGYYFIGLKKQGQGSVDLRTGFVFAAVPAEYGGDTKDTFVVGPTGRVFSKDIGPEPIWDAAQVDASWREVE